MDRKTKSRAPAEDAGKDAAEDAGAHAGTPTGTPHVAGSDPLHDVRRPIIPQAFDIRIAADGRWYHEGGEIARPALVRLFASVLQREPDGSYWLVTPVERGRIDVDDVPFIIIAADIEGDGTDQVIRLRSNVEDEIVLGPGHQLVMRRPPDGDDLRPYVMVRPGLEGRIARPVFYELAALGVAGPDGRIGVWSGGTFHCLDGDTA